LRSDEIAVEKVSRRQFLIDRAKAAAGLVAFPALVPGEARGKGAVPPSSRVTMGCIGVGWQGATNLRAFLEDTQVQVVAVCDVDQQHLDQAKRLVDARYGNRDCAAYSRFEELITRKDIDAVMLAVPDHWHSVPAVEAARAGKDIYGEKPLAYNWVEARAICRAVKRYGRVWQTGNFQRSLGNFRFACELVQNGRIGKVKTVEVGLPDGHYDFAKTAEKVSPCAPPPHLDYDRWLGPAPYSPYCPARVHMNWRWNLDYGSGSITDWGAHHLDIAHWGLGFDDTGPLEVEGTGDFPRQSKLWNAPTRYWVTFKYPGDITMITAAGFDAIRFGIRWIGDLGWVWVNRDGIEAHPKALFQERIGPDEINLRRSPGHYREFIECVQTRGTTMAPCSVALNSLTPAFLALIAMRTGRKVRWDPTRQKIIGDPHAERLLSRPMRPPWHL